jgi:hypothetical protein
MGVNSGSKPKLAITTRANVELRNAMPLFVSN